MRFLLKPSSSSIVANTSHVIPSSKAAAASAPTAINHAHGTAKAWGQQCSPNCGCVLRIDAQLSDTRPSSASPTIVKASYHAKRVMATPHKTCDDTTHLKPLTTTKTNSRPILTSCTCPTLHHLAQRTVDHLPGRTLAQIRNEIDMGTAGSARSSIAFRHTVIRENVLPAIESTKKELGIAKIASIEHHDKRGSNTEEDDTGVHAMESTHSHGHCYDLVEDSLSSMIHERMPIPRHDNYAESYSPTLGGPLRLYSPTGRKEPINDGLDDDTHQQDERESELTSIYEVGDWQRKSPSSFFLFGGESNGHGMGNSFGMTKLFIRSLHESFSERLLGGEAKPPALVENETDRRTTTYLQLLDMYGDDLSSDEDEELAMDDWLEYVDAQQRG